MASYLALDIGEKRIGLALADVAAPFPAPLITLEASEHLAKEFEQLLKKNNVSAVIIGFPRNQQGQRTAQTDRVEYIAGLLNIPKSIPVYWQDESLTSVKAEAELKKRKKPYAKGAVDSLAATYILEDFLAAGGENHHSSQHSKDSQPKTAKKNRKKHQHAGIKIFFGLLVATVLGALLLTGWYLYALSPKTVKDTYSVVSIQPGDSASTIAGELEQKQVIKSALAFKIYIRLHNISGLQAGEYRLSSKQSSSEIASILSSGKVTTVNILIPPGQRLDQIITILQDKGFAKEDIENALQNAREHPLLADVPNNAKLEGYLFADTYKVGPSTTADQLITLMLDTFEKRISEQTRNGLKNQGLTLNQGVILASIVQKEVADAKTQKTVAQVFLKRYKEGKALGSDVTSLYGAFNDGINLPSGAAAAAAVAIAHDSPYNTRKTVGLPPTAISNFNISALEAVANPSATNYLFFVAGDNGVTYFANTLEEHEANVAKYCQKGCG